MSKSKILIVEDEWIIAIDIKKSLLNLGYSVIAIVSTGEEAVRKAEDKKPDLVLMDIVLQGEIDGTEAAAMIISRLDIPVIYLSAYTDEDVLKRSRKTKASGFLVKPFNDRELKATIDLAIYKHRMERKLRESENHLRITLKSINDAVISTDKNGSVIFMNPVAQDLTGLSMSEAEGKALHEIFNIGSVDKTKDVDVPANRIIREGKAITQEKFVLTTKSGSVNIELSSAPITDEKMQLNGAVVVFRDITERIENEKKLDNYRKELEQLAEERTAKLKLFSDIVENSPDGVQILDLDGHIIYSNPAIEEIFGFPCEDIKGKHMSTMNADEDFASEVIIPSIRKNGRWDGELIARKMDNKLFSIWLVAFTVKGKDDNPIAVISIVRDLTERKIAQTALQQSEQKYSSLFHHSSDAIMIHNFEGRILDANNKMLEQFGYSGSEILSLKINDLFPAEEPEKTKIICDLIAEKGIVNSEVNFKKKNNLVFPAEVSSTLLDIGGNKVIQCIVRDISERKKNEYELTKHREHLEEMIKERTFELLEANENLKVEINVRKQVEKKLLNYQKQLQSLTSQISLIEEREKRRIATELHDSIGQTLALTKLKLEMLNKSAQSDELKNIIREILKLIEQTIKGTRALTFELSPPVLYELGLNQALKWLVDEFREKYGIFIILESDNPDIPFDNNTRFILFQAVRELLVNIVKHAHAKKTKINIMRDDNKLKIIIEDDGVGFESLSVTSSGYGLFNIRERMNHINGVFEIKSKPGHGTRVTIVAPFTKNKPENEI